ncbi:MOSC domain-containing protein [Aquihabitans sp. G128]|uniref:MOSC domain-containing protein n=1 Tax=Aquihabitans sp. G128 TaxID=2849779 RepID=UPI001C241277|nr:MOSC domain-containing protein [Aquihabitans sp. G128]QXC61221.1 MOSC domain-containing protein [Aquihabitans sp. G128]
METAQTAIDRPAATDLGRVARCWRYPVKSLQGLEVGAIDVTATGVAGDRTHGLIGAGDGHLLSAKRTSALLDASATDQAITLADGTVIALDDPDADERLTAWLGRPVHLARSEGTDPVSYEMTFDPPDDGAEYYEIPAAPGSFLDLAAVHLVTTATLDGLAAARPDLDWDVRRFRPNLLLDVDGPTFVEQGWIGRHVRVGTAVLSIDTPTVRCAMPLRAQPGGIERQPEIFRALNELNTVAPNHLGAYCSVVTPGAVRPGDPVELLDA